MKCDGRPDPSSKKDINTFINLTKEDSSNTDMRETLKTCEMVIEVNIFFIRRKKLSRWHFCVPNLTNKDNQQINFLISKF